MDAEEDAVTGDELEGRQALKEAAYPRRGAGGQKKRPWPLPTEEAKANTTDPEVAS